MSTCHTFTILVKYKWEENLIKTFQRKSIEEGNFNIDDKLHEIRLLRPHTTESARKRLIYGANNAEFTKFLTSLDANRDTDYSLYEVVKAARKLQWINLLSGNLTITRPDRILIRPRLLPNIQSAYLLATLSTSLYRKQLLVNLSITSYLLISREQ